MINTISVYLNPHGMSLLYPKLNTPRQDFFKFYTVVFFFLKICERWKMLTSGFVMHCCLLTNCFGIIQRNNWGLFVQEYLLRKFVLKEKHVYWYKHELFHTKVKLWCGKLVEILDNMFWIHIGDLNIFGF